MKKILFFVFVFSACFLPNNHHSQFAVSAAVNQGGNNNGKIVKTFAKQTNKKSDKTLAATIKRLTNRSTEGLAVQKTADGEYSIDFQDRFQNAMLSKMDDDGELNAACVTSVEEANDFFGRNLETGEPIASRLFQKEDRKTTAARHGMSVDEFEFYKNLIEEAEIRRADNPNAATLTISNADGANEGFNDTTATAPEGGNSGTTLGEQRLNLFNFAAGIWGAYLDSSVPIVVSSQFNPQTPCSSGGGILGSAGTAGGYINFPNAPYRDTFYHVALANKISGSDRNGATAEINATFNSSVDAGCLGTGTRFYYGLDGTTPSQRINLLVVLLHEMGHGLGFSSFVNGTTGALPSGYADVYTRFMYDRSIGKYWYQMTDAERQTSALNTGNVLWDGPNVKIASGFLTAGREASTGRVQLFTPNPYQGGSSISHWDTAAFPNLLMEPKITSGLPVNLDLTRQQMRDIGWYRDTTADLIPDTITNVQIGNNAAYAGTSAIVTWTNTGGFNRNVTIELSIDGGATFSQTIASDVANTGSYTFNVPSYPTAQGRIRVREYDYVAPQGVSAANFSINAPTAATVSAAGRVVDSFGRGIGRARVAISGTGGETIYAVTNSFGYFRFDELAAGGTYVFQVRHKRYTFAPQVNNISEDSLDLKFVAQ